MHYCVISLCNKLPVNAVLIQWRRNEFESGRNPSGAKVGGPIRKFFFGRAPPLFGSKSVISIS